MVRIVLQVLDGHVLEQSAIWSKDLIRPGTELFPIRTHDPRAPFLQPQITPWEEVPPYVH